MTQGRDATSRLEKLIGHGCADSEALPQCAAKPPATRRPAECRSPERSSIRQARQPPASRSALARRAKRCRAAPPAWLGPPRAEPMRRERQLAEPPPRKASSALRLGAAMLGNADSDARPQQGFLFRHPAWRDFVKSIN